MKHTTFLMTRSLLFSVLCNDRDEEWSVYFASVQQRDFIFFITDGGTPYSHTVPNNIHFHRTVTIL